MCLKKPETPIQRQIDVDRSKLLRGRRGKENGRGMELSLMVMVGAVNGSTVGGRGSRGQCSRSMAIDLDRRIYLIIDAIV